ncbi:hypothetical protein GCM10011571_07800 [Marinithermofilum abyssi]|uniref:Uncharacterized protein n=1 Tax=Marinithermofilum abyssi TaxID=1571185 RepID=A0A8J2YA91_9BACL|nr:hypothetical protein [Marinithermofilum abyssi]GGE08929.1 hypothetical protein GCM10011571_07800 [Marinithermofilum abyssi]
MGASLFLKRLEQIGKDTLRLRLDRQLPVPEEQNGCYRVRELGAWMEEQAERIAEQLDQRNGNDYYGRLLDENQALLKQVRPLEKSKGAKP